MTRTIATWMAPVLCFTAQDVADELGRTTGEPFDVHGGVRVGGRRRARSWATQQALDRRDPPAARGDPAAAGGVPRRRPQVAGGARAGHARPRPSGPHWQWSLAHLAELCVVSRVELDATDAAGPRRSSPSTRRPGPTCPRCWRRTGESAGARRRRSEPVPALRRRDWRQCRNERESIHRERPNPAPSARRKYLLFTIFTIISLVLDQWTKVLARGHLRPLGSRNAKVIVEGYFDLRYAENPGVAFSMLQDIPGRAGAADPARGRRVLAGPLLSAQDADRQHAAAHRAGSGGRRRDRQPRRPRASTEGSRTSWSGRSACTNGRRSTSPTRRFASAWG